MKQYLKELVITLLNLFMFYVFPLFGGTSDGQAMIILILITTFILSVAIGTISNSKLKVLYPVFISLLYIPSTIMHFNIMNILWYLIIAVVSLLGLLSGLGLLKIATKKR